MNSSNYDFTCTAYYKINEETQNEKLIEMPKDATYYDLIKDPFVHTSSVIINSSILRGTRFSNLHYEDLALWLCLLKKGRKIHCLNLPLATYYIQSGSRSRKKWKAPFWIWQVYRNSEYLNIPKSLFYLSCYCSNRLIQQLQ